MTAGPADRPGPAAAPDRPGPTAGPPDTPAGHRAPAPAGTDPTPGSPGGMPEAPAGHRAPPSGPHPRVVGPVTPAGPDPTRSPLARWGGYGLWALLALPLAVGALAMRHPRWYPIADLAQTELRVRDVGGRHMPLMGLAGRIGRFPDSGSHPGPLSFWLLAGPYRLLGSSAAALVAASVLLHSAALGLSLWLARRRGGLPLAAVLTGALAVLVRSYGVQMFVEPWNPYLPVLWWVAFLLAVWSVLDGDPPALAVAVVAGSFAAQTHLPYLGLVGGMAVVLAGPLLLALGRERAASRSGPAPADHRGPAGVPGPGDAPEPAGPRPAVPGRRRRGAAAGGPPRRLLRWTLASVALAAALWTPTALDQAFGTGNLTKIRDSLSEPSEPVTGLAAGARELLSQVDPSRLVLERGVLGTLPAESWDVGGIALVGAWAAAAVGAWRLGHRRLLRLHAVVGAALVLGLVSTSRVYGDLWYYLFLWAAGITTLALVAIGWTALAAATRRGPAARARRVPAVVATGLAVAVVVSAAFTVENADARPTRPDLSAQLGAVTGPTVAALESGRHRGGGRDGRYLVRWTDRIHIGSQGFGLLNELERAGFAVGVDGPFGAGAVRWRVLPRAEATALVQLVVGPDVPAWQDRPEAEQIAYVDPRSAAEVAEQARLTASIDRRLRAAGLDENADEWARNQFTGSLRPDVPPDVHDDMRRVLDIGGPVAVFLAPVPDR